MNHAELIAKVNDVMHRGFEIPKEKLVPTASLFEDLGLDSLDAVDMLVHLEENLGIKVEGERLMKIKTLQDVYQLVMDVDNGAETQESKATLKEECEVGQ